MTRRRDARRIAVAILYQADLTGRSPLEVLDERRSLGEAGAVSGFAEDLVRGVTENRQELDAVIGEHAEGWTVARMASVDRTLLRVASYEILFREDVPAAVAIDEAVDAAKELSTEDSGRFVNGVLGKIVQEREERAGAG
jgi:transcription antitermination protein NusB